MQITHLEHIISSLSQQGYAISPNFLPATTISALAKLAHEEEQKGQLKDAATGTKAIINNSERIRGDKILWLEEYNQAECVRTYFQKMDILKNEFNRQFFLNLHEYEAHLAIYPPGTGYAKHLDQFNQGKNSLRQVTCVLYLNEDWREEFGGQLRLYLANNNTVEILPKGGTLVTFMSGDFWHEVLPAIYPRLSLTGWFRRRDDRLI
ncbi:MAG TPA: 2OG-Fe(II) oxygenase [Methylophilus sp.]|nr:2OG-Fe(II) oxygenase [Methylophilus sp.]HQQ33238.1 2OG-Fe(II) oxygenase [Methylophilus sp.]